jgi:hypothetical protein
MRTAILSAGLLAAALIAGPQATFAQSQEKPYCLESPTGAMNCLYDSFEQCQQIRGGRTLGGGCIPNPARSGTTGRGGMDAPRGRGPTNTERTPLPGGGAAPQQ